jgi:plastocyanin domain-containing protein
MRNRWSLMMVASLGLWGSIGTHGAIAQRAVRDGHDVMHPSSTQFRRIEQPLWLKGGITAGGVGLIGLELWWFLGHHAKSSAQVEKRT